ncbi:MAG: hypothetical protein SH847_20580 [Roseiflexaceae bacterium]|nr:hypothetical protein [Roseiflexaceae bacterium]
MRRLLPFILFCMLACVVMPAQAQSQPIAVTLDAHAGYGGAYRAGEWFPVIIDVANDGPDLRGELVWELPGQRNEPSFRYSVDLPRGSRKRITINAFSRGFARSGQVRLLSNDVVLADRSVSIDPIDSDKFVIGVVGSDPTLLNTLETLQISGSNGTVVRHLQDNELPDQALALRGLNSLFIADADTSQLSVPQRESISLWATLGGQLIIGGGVGGQRAAAGLTALLPADVGLTVAEGDITALVQVGNGPLPSGSSRAPLSELRPRSGAVDLSKGAGLLYRSNYGVGSVTIAAFDLGLLRGWLGEPTLWGTVVTSIPLFTPGIGSRTNQTSILQSVLQLPGLGLPSAWTLLLFLVGYTLVIGPINYFVLRRLRRLELAWLSVPLVVIIFAGGLYIAGFGLRGSQSQLSQVTVVQASEGQQRALATGFVALFSPRRANYTVGFPSATLIHETRSFDDISARTTPVMIDEQRAELRDLLIDIASVRTLVAELPIDAPPTIESSVESSDQGVHGQIRNSGGIALDNVLVVRGGSFVDIGSLAPGASANFDFNSAARNFPWGVNLPEEGLFNRKTLVNSLFNGDATLYATGSGPLGDTGAYVIAWTNQPSLPMQIDSHDQVQNGYTLYVIRLKQ